MSPHAAFPFTPPLADGKGRSPVHRGPAPQAPGSARTPLVYWPAVAAAALVALFILTGLLAWLASRPGSRTPVAHVLASAPAAKPALPPETPPAPLPRETPAATVTTPAAPASAPAKPAPLLDEVKWPVLELPPILPVEKPAKTVAVAVPVVPVVHEEARQLADPEPQQQPVVPPPPPALPALPPVKPLPTAPAAPATAAPPAAPVCQTERYGTSVDFLNNPQVALRQARTQQKLVFLLHVSGNFEDNCFT